MTYLDKPVSLPIVLMLLGSAAAGAVALALTTPKSGKETRTALRNLGSRLRARVRGGREDRALLAPFA